ncbi:SDR family oxidoreductase [Pseudarthrobacter sp. PvP090]|uniref:SDR family oxidoreductase n=1 Tax=Pseudarthrobacter sp. PvP090 TaxID=3156393 RepID=UPI0033969D0B
MTTQRVLITAGAGGIGRAIAEAYVDAGAKVHIADVDAEALGRILAEHDGVSGTAGDISKADDVARIIADAKEHLGGLDVLVNNAGISGPTAPVEDFPAEAWDSVISVNLNGTFNVTQQAIPLLKESAAGAIVVMSSLAGRFDYPNRAAYSTTKWGLVGFTKTLALELGEFGITANSVHPGAVDGPRFRSVIADRAELSGRTAAEELEDALALQSVKRLVDPADIAALVLFLTGPHGRSISGQMIPIDGDSKAAS